MDKIIYLLEDDQSICDLITTAFSLNEYSFKYFNTIETFKTALKTQAPDLVLLDIMLSDGSGLDVLTLIKTDYPEIYCIMLSALSKEIDKVKALNMGADDYISKPFSVLELIAKVNAIFRRLENKTKNNVIVKGQLSINNDDMTATIDGEPLEITNREFKLIKLFITNCNKVLTRESILNNLWGYDVGEVRTLDNYVNHLRKLGVNGIETVYGVGYKFNIKE